jgi:hypothetical protein
MTSPRLLLVAALASGCGGATVNAGGRDTLRPLERVRVIRVVQEALAARGLRAEAARAIRVTGRVSVDCDVPIAGSHDCVEYVGEGDRARYRAAIPAHDNPDALVVTATAEGDVGGHVLFLDDRDFRYESDLDRAGPGHPTVGEVEDRVRRVALDFAVWLRGQGRR